MTAPTLTVGPRDDFARHTLTYQTVALTATLSANLNVTALAPR